MCKKNNLISFFITITYFIVFFLLFSSGYETNDDAAIQLIARGNMSGSPSPYLIYVGLGIGKLLQMLYGFSEKINWYPLMLYSLNFISIFFAIRLLMNFKNRFYVFCLICIFLIFVTTILVSLQFTSTSILLGSIAFLQIYHSTQSKLLQKELIIGYLFLFVGVMLRFDTLYVFIFLGFPILFYRKKNAVQNFLLLGFVVMLFVEKSIEMNIYADKVGFNYREYLYAQDVILDNPTKDISKALIKMNWTKNDFELLRRWFFIDSDVFSNRKIVDFSHEIVSASTKKLFLARLYDLLFYKINYLIINIMLFGVVWKMNKSTRREILIHIASVFFIFILFAYKFRIQDRVVIPILIFSYSYMSYIFILNYVKLNKYFLIISFMLVLNSAYWLYMNDRFFSDQNKSKSLELNQYLKVMNKYPDKLFIVADAILPLEGSSSKLNFNAMNHVKLMGSGWSTFSPSFNDRLQKQKTKNLMLSIPLDKNIVIISQDTTMLQIMKQFYYEHYNWKVVFKNVINPNLPFYEFNVEKENFENRK